MKIPSRHQSFSPQPKRSRSGPSSILAGLSLLLLLNVAHASFHAWEVVEVYSSADGSVQFIEMRALSGGQQNLSCCGTRISSTNSLGVNQFIFGTNLPADTFSKTCLIGTASLASVPGGVTPDYVIPANFIRPPVGGGAAAVIFSGNSSTALFTNLPTDGRSALLRSGTTMIIVPTNSPRNFYDVSNSIVPVQLETAAVIGSEFLISFATAAGPNGSVGPNYAVEAKSAVDSTNWSTVTNVTGNGTIKTVAFPFSPFSNMFFRLRVP